ncbi:MAG TPA: hypothetical protein VJT15_18605 [Pyrinomonadaceae bacterium]|nr:hypothetical protein [Pyrinomonadaceae bacterium]
MLKVVAILILTAFPVVASTSNRVVIRDSVAPAHREELTQRLRAITGWSELAFADDGSLQIATASVEKGSGSARDLLTRAVAGSRMILFEDASSRKDVVFCRVVPGKFAGELPAGVDVYLVLIDFDDFRQVSGDKQARAAFDVGWAVLHEIDHVVEDSQDPTTDTSLGECEAHINEMRRELGLPTRNSYFFSFLPIKNDPNFMSRFVRLGFDHTNSASAKTKRYWLIWDAAIVGGLNPDCTETTGFTRLSAPPSSSPRGSGR